MFAQLGYELAEYRVCYCSMASTFFRFMSILQDNAI
jgi:hypothetical protein